MEKRNISISSKNGYTLEKVLKAKEYLDEIGSNKRQFPFARLVQMYNDIKGTHESEEGCRCNSPKYFNGLMNFYVYGKLTLINNGLAKAEDFERKEDEDEAKPIENEGKRIKLVDIDPNEIDEDFVKKAMHPKASLKPRKKGVKK